MTAKALLAAGLSTVLTLLVGQPTADEIRELQWHLDYLNIDQAHAITKGKGVVVGVVDTGVDAAHPDLKGSVLAGADFTALATQDGWTDLDGHGTAMAGLIAAHGRATGISPEASVLPVRMVALRDNFQGSNTVSDTPIDWAVDHGANVLCLAFGQSDLPALKESIARAVTHDVVVVAAMANSNQSSGRDYPAGYPDVVAVVGTDRDANHAAISGSGPGAVLSAPAVEIVSTASQFVSRTGYLQSSGTSDATAIVAGVAALVRAKFPELSAGDSGLLRSRLERFTS